VGLNAYVVGGFVRDLILGVENFDIDIVVEGDALMFSENLHSIIRHTLQSTTDWHCGGGAGR